jgi:hypothetical protein
VNDIFTPAYRLTADCTEALVMAAFAGEPIHPEIANIASTASFRAKQDTPGNIWWNCEPYHPAIARALKIDRTQDGGVYALAPFRLWHDGTRHLILAAYPCPRILGPIDMDATEIETVIAWNPVTDEAFALKDETPGLFGSDAPTVFRSPLEFFQSWAIERAKFYVSFMNAKGREWHHTADADACPGALAIGPIEQIRWNTLPREFEARGIDPTELNRAIIRQANLPRAYSTNKRAAA